MTIAKKPSYNKINEDFADTIIGKGGSSPYNSEDIKNDNIKITIRFSSKMLNVIDVYLEECINKKTRTCWVREAVEEKIKRDITKQG